MKDAPFAGRFLFQDKRQHIARRCTRCAFNVTLIAGIKTGNLQAIVHRNAPMTTVLRLMLAHFISEITPQG